MGNGPRRLATTVAVVLCVVLVCAGLAVVGSFIFFFAAMSNYGSNK